VLRRIDIAEQALSLLQRLVSIYGVHNGAMVERLEHMNRSTSITNKLRIINEKVGVAG
jgi:hypothetical protein